MDDMIRQLLEARGAIQNLEGFVPTQHNCNQILASIQRIDTVIAFLKSMGGQDD